MKSIILCHIVKHCSLKPDAKYDGDYLIIFKVIVTRNSAIADKPRDA